MKFLVRACAYVLAVSALIGCAVGNVYDYQTAPVVLPLQGDYSIALTVIDERPYVKSGKKPANFVGIRRGGYGNPFNVTTASGEPLTDDMRSALIRALENAGYSLANSGEIDRTVTLTVNEWKSDVYSNLKIIFDLALVVEDANGQVLSKTSIQGEEAAGGGAMMDQHNESVRQAFEAKMTQLFIDPEVKAALTR